jgi:O-antigen/teichoic acid export membrane protein
MSLLNEVASIAGIARDSKKGVEDVVVSMIPQIVMLIAGLISSVLIARGLGTTGMGYYAIIMSVSGFVTVLTDLGINHTAIRYASLAASHDDTEGQLAVLRWAFRLRMALAFLVTVIVCLLAPYLADIVWKAGEIAPLLQLSLLICIFGAIAAVPMVYFQSIKRFRMNAIVSTGQTVISMIGILIIAWLGHWSLELVITVSVIASFAGMLAFIILVPRASFISASNLKKPVKDLVGLFLRAPAVNIGRSLDDTDPNKFALYMMVSSIAVAIMMRSDIWLMGFYLSDKGQVGIYSVAMYFTIPLTVILGAINTALWPRGSALKTAGETVRLLKTTFYLSAAVAVPGLAYSIVGPYFMPLIFGQAYGSGVLLGQILCFSYCIAILMCPLGVIGYSFGMVKEFWWINIIQLSAVIAINVLFLPSWGPLAAALAFAAQNLIGFVIGNFILYRKIMRLSMIRH